MNNWRAVGYIFASFGLIFLLVGIFLGIIASSLVGQYVPQLAQTLFMAAFTPWAIIASLMFVVGFVGLYAGRTPLTTEEDNQLKYPDEKPKTTESARERYEKSLQNPVSLQVSTSPISLQASPPLPKQAACPSCGQPIIFMEQHQRWYCPQERKYV